MTAFTGFPRETFKFLSGLAAHNSKEWFEAHREDYERYHLAPAKAFVEAIAPGLKKISKTVNAEPRVNGSIFRINRDVRFSKDKRPYKTTLDVWFWEGDKRGWEAPGFFLRLAPAAMIAGAGMHRFTPVQLAAYRAAIVEEKAGAALEKIVAGLGELHLGEPARKTLPRGFDAAHRRAALLLHEGLHAIRESPLPASVHSDGFVAECLAVFRAAAPVSAWLLAHVAKPA
jgi:uncharacterized protein (TIGR02453 family)